MDLSFARFARFKRRKSSESSALTALAIDIEQVEDDDMEQEAEYQDNSVVGKRVRRNQTTTIPWPVSAEGRIT